MEKDLYRILEKRQTCLKQALKGTSDKNKKLQLEGSIHELNLVMNTVGLIEEEKCIKKRASNHIVKLPKAKKAENPD